MSIRFRNYSDIKLTPVQKQFYRPIFSLVGKSYLRRYCTYIDFYFSVMDRLEYLQKFKSYLRKVQDNSRRPLKQDVDLIQINHMYNQHMEFVRDTLTRLDINNTIDHLRNDGSDDDELREIYLDWRYYIDEYPKYVMDAYFGISKQTGRMDKAALILIKGTYGARRAEYIQRLNQEVSQRHSQGWFFVFDTLTIAPDELQNFYDSESPIRDYTRRIGRLVNAAAGRKVADSFNDIYRYFIVPEYGDLSGRLHFHCLHMMKYLPKGTEDPTLGIDFRGNPQRTRREIESLKGLWSFGITQPISVRYTNDNYTIRLGWRVPIDKRTGCALKLKSVQAVVSYIAKYVSKNIDTKAAKKLERSKEKWASQLLKLKVAKSEKTFRVRMTRGFGMEVASMSRLSIPALKQLMQLHWSVSKINVVLKKNASAEMLSRMVELKLEECLQVLPSQSNMLQHLRNLMKVSPNLSTLSSTASIRPKLGVSDISNEVWSYIKDNGYEQPEHIRFKESVGAK